MRWTPQTRLVLEIVRRAQDHPTAATIYKRAATIMPDISLATVYRNLDKLADEGHIRKVMLSDQVARFDCNTGNHYHIRCEQCGRVDDLPMSFMEDLERALRGQVGYTISGHHLEVVGWCPACQGQADAARADDR